jgi:nitrogen fixation protein NifQ
MQACVGYDWLMDRAEGAACDRFDAHVLASIYSLAIAETRTSGISLSEATGARTSALRAIMSAVFPPALPLLDDFAVCSELFVPEDERSLRELLTRFSTSRSPVQQHLAALIARRAMRPNHLWQDLGLRNRGELSELMRRHFEPLAKRNVNDMKWKKFLYRTICRDEGFRLCTAPSCAECNDFAVCFGVESGESLLARNRRNSEVATVGETTENDLTCYTITCVYGLPNGP